MGQRMRRDPPIHIDLQAVVTLPHFTANRDGSGARIRTGRTFLLELCDDAGPQDIVKFVHQLRGE